MTKFVMNQETEIKVAVEGKSQAALREELIAMGGNIGKTSLSKLLSGSQKEVCGFILVEMADNTAEADLVVVTAEAAIDTGAQTTEPLASTPAPRTSPFAALMGGQVPDHLKSSATPSVEKPKAAEKAKTGGAKRGAPKEFFAAQHPDLMKAVESFTGGKVMRVVQNRILIIQDAKQPTHVVHVNLLKEGYTVTEYKGGKSTKYSKKVAEPVEVVATLKELIVVDGLADAAAAAV